MKYISLFLLCAAVTFADDFITGQAARLVIGQVTFTQQDSNSSDTVLGGVSGLAFAADTLFVADSNRVGAAPSNHRVLLFQNVSGQFPSPTAELPDNRKCPVCVGQANVVLGQPDFTTTTENIAANQSSLRLPTSVASDGVHVVVADTNHNRVLIWNQIPTTNNAPADVVVGQPDFTHTSIPGNLPNAKAMRGPQGVWIQNGKLYVADTQYNRVLIFNQIPTSNGAAADVVLGQPNMTTFVEPDLTQQTSGATASNLLNPVAVSSDGTRLIITDLGFNRILIWDTIPTANGQPADVVVGQPDMVSAIPNNAFSVVPGDTTLKETAVLCTTSNGTDLNNNPTFPPSCNATISFPRFALSTGSRLFVADGGNDRVMVFNTIPTQNAPSADFIIGQIGGSVNQASDAADSLRTPMSMAWDGTNLYVSDAYNLRITVYSIGANTIPFAGVRNAASLDIKASGNVAFASVIATTTTTTTTIATLTPVAAGDSVDINIGGVSGTDSTGLATITGGADYTYTAVAADTINTIISALVAKINSANNGSGDPNASAFPDLTTGLLLLNAKASGPDGNNVTYFATVKPATTSGTASFTATAAAPTLSGGGDAASIAPGSLVSVIGSNLSFGTEVADLSQNTLPTKLAGTEVYFNGIVAPLLYVSPTQINAQIPWELNDTTSVNAFVRAQRADGSVLVTTPVAVTIVPANPGIYTLAGTSPVAGVVLHGSSTAAGVVSVDGLATANDTATVTIEDRPYTYTVLTGDTLDSIRDGLVALINHDPKVTATPSGVFDRILLQARVQGPEGNGIVYAASASASATVVMTAIGTQLCCANVANSLVTQANPAVSGELIIVLATGLGLPVLNGDNIPFISTGVKFPVGGPVTTPVSSVNSIAGGKTADVISATLLPGSVGNFQVLLHLNPGVVSDPFTQLTIAQDLFVSNIVTLPVVNPNQ